MANGVFFLRVLILSTLLASCEYSPPGGIGRVNDANGQSGEAVLATSTAATVVAADGSVKQSGGGHASGRLAKRIESVRSTAFPRRAAWVIADFKLGNASEQAALARFDLVMLGLYPGWTKDGFSIQTAAQALKSIKPSLIVGNYSILNEAYLASDAAFLGRYKKIQAMNWWLRNAAGERVQWTSEYGAWDVNITSWTAPDASGQRYPQWAAGYFDQQYFSAAPVFDVWFFDNVMNVPRDPPADWKLNGTNQKSADAEIAAAYRAGHAAEWAEARKLEPDMLLMGNADNDLSSPEYKGRLNSVQLECLTGKSWSIEAWGGWGQMMSRYRAVAANLQPPQIAVFGACGGATDYAMFRYSLASALMADGYFAYSPSQSYGSAPWFDEYDVSLGAALQPAVTAAYQNGVYRRDFQNGIVLVNPRGNGTQTVTLGATFYKIAGAQDPTTNNGLPVISVTLNAADGIVLTRK